MTYVTWVIKNIDLFLSIKYSLVSSLKSICSYVLQNVSITNVFTVLRMVSISWWYNILICILYTDYNELYYKQHEEYDFGDL